MTRSDDRSAIIRAWPSTTKPARGKEARDLIAEPKTSLTIGIVLMVINRVSGLVLALHVEVPHRQRDRPAPRRPTTAARRHRRAGHHRPAATSFALSQVVSVAAQRAITEMRKRVQAHSCACRSRTSDSTKTGVLISRIMSDAEGVRNLVGTGLIQLLGSILTAFMAVGFSSM